MGGYKFKSIEIVYNEDTDMADIRVAASCINDSAPYFDIVHPLTTFDDVADFLGGTLFDNGWFLSSALNTRLGQAVSEARHAYDANGGFHDDIKEMPNYRQALETVYAEMLNRQKRVIEQGRKRKAV